MNRYSVYCYDKQPLPDPGGGAKTFRLLFCSFFTKKRKNTYVLVAVMSFNVETSILQVMVQIRRKGPKRSEHVGMQKGANFTIVSTKVLIGLNIKFYQIFAKQHVH